MKKKMVSRLLTMVMAVALCISLCLSASAATLETEMPTGVTVIVDLDKDTLYESDQDQEVVVSVSLSQDVAIAGYQIDAFKDDLTTVWCGGELGPTLSVPADWYPGAKNCFWVNSTYRENVEIAANAVLGTLTYTIPAGTPAGEYSVGVKEMLCFYKNYEDLVAWEEPMVLTLTILPAEVDIEDPDVPLDPQPGDPDSPYTITIARDGEGVVHAGDTVTMNVTVSGADCSGVAFNVNYDTDVFEYSGTSTEFKCMDKDGYQDGAVVATLTFTAKDVSKTTEGRFILSDATADTFGTAMSENAKAAATVNASVTVTRQYTVTFQNKDGSTLGAETVDDGGVVTSVPAAPAVENYSFKGWSNGTATLTADDIKAQVVTGDVTYTAVYDAASYAITLPEGVTGAETAAYGEDYTGTIDNYDGDAYDYTVTYQVNGGEEKTAAVNDNGAFIIPGDDITGDVTVKVSKQVNGVTVSVVNDYVTGWTLVKVENENGAVPAAGYCYNGNQMFYSEQYKAYVWLVEGTLSGANINDVTVGAGNVTTVAQTYDVNSTGKVDFNDALTAFGCYNVTYDVAQNMLTYLRADVNGDGVVNADDVTAVMQSEGYKNVQD